MIERNVVLNMTLNCNSKVLFGGYVFEPSFLARFFNIQYIRQSFISISKKNCYKSFILVKNIYYYPVICVSKVNFI